MCFNIGDIVRIKSRQQLELEGHKFKEGDVIDRWHDSICEITHVTGEHEHRYKLKFVDKIENPCRTDKIYYELEDYSWYEFELENIVNEIKLDYKKIKESDIDKLFN